MYFLQKKDLLKPKTYCSIKAIDGGNYYDFIVTSILRDAFIVQALKKNDAPCWKSKDKIEVQILSDSAIYEFSSSVICSINTNSPIYVLESPQHIKRIQRRQYVRYNYGLTLSFSPVENKNQWKLICPRIKAKTLNISGGGLCLTWSRPLQEKTLVAITMSLPFDKSSPEEEILIQALGEVRRCVEYNGKYSIGVEFKEIDKRDREKIIGFIFEQMRKDAKSRRSFARIF